MKLHVLGQLDLFATVCLCEMFLDLVRSRLSIVLETAESRECVRASLSVGQSPLASRIFLLRACPMVVR